MELGLGYDFLTVFYLSAMRYEGGGGKRLLRTFSKEGRCSYGWPWNQPTNSTEHVCSTLELVYWTVVSLLVILLLSKPHWPLSTSQGQCPGVLPLKWTSDEWWGMSLPNPSFKNLSRERRKQTQLHFDLAVSSSKQCQWNSKNVFDSTHHLSTRSIPLLSSKDKILTGS